MRAYPNIDWCENNKEETIAVNIGGAINVALAAIKINAYLIHISSGCVYAGGPKTPFSEEDEPNFFGSFYSRSRITAQCILKELPVLQLRIRMPVSCVSHQRNLINKLISYKKVISVPNSITLIEDMFPAIEKLSRLCPRPIGILNLVNDGYLKHEDVLRVYKEMVNKNHKYTLITQNELESGIVKAQRSNCVLSNEKARSLGIKMPALNKERLKKIMRLFKKSLEAQSTMRASRAI